MMRSRSWRRPTRPMRWPASELQSWQVHRWLYYRSAPRDQAVPVLREKMLLWYQRSPAEFLQVTVRILPWHASADGLSLCMFILWGNDATGKQPCLHLEPTGISGIQRQAVASADIVHFADTRTPISP